MDGKKHLYFLAAFFILAFFVLSDNSNFTDVLEETSEMRKSKSKDWWLSSGGMVHFGKEGFRTNFGSLPRKDRWRKIYAGTNPSDTQGGYLPQNLFRLVLRKRFKDLSQSVYFSIAGTNLADSRNRNQSNGILLFNRYQDENNLYYTGVRVDGSFVIKKKIGGKYHTIAEKKIFDGSYDKDRNPNVIPEETWIGMKSEVENAGGSVDIRLYADRGSGWEPVLQAKDSGDRFGAPFFEEGHAGIRSDFMDVRFRNYEAEEMG